MKIKVYNLADLFLWNVQILRLNVLPDMCFKAEAFLVGSFISTDADEGLQVHLQISGRTDLRFFLSLCFFTLIF
jgi:hypothetical protein